MVQEIETNTYSKFWMPLAHIRSREEQNTISVTERVMILEQYRLAIANFVKIVSQKDIPVYFEAGDDSSTNFKTVTISADMYENSYDSTVGLALHEATHITDSDLKLFNREHIQNILPAHFFTAGIMTPQVLEYFCELFNWVEDNRIDALQYEKSPGYRGYYQAMMDRYFYSTEITKALESEFFRDETMDSYFFRVINIINSGTDLTALKGLKEISEILDIQNIDRLHSTQECYDYLLRVKSVNKTFTIGCDVDDIDWITDGEFMEAFQNGECPGDLQFF